MARLKIDEIERVEKERNTIHEAVYTTYSVFEKDGNKYVQLDTYGKDGRDIPGKISQSIQFDEESARYIVDLLAKEFGMLFKISR